MVTRVVAAPPDDVRIMHVSRVINARLIIAPGAVPYGKNNLNGKLFRKDNLATFNE